MATELDHNEGKCLIYVSLSFVSFFLTSYRSKNFLHLDELQGGYSSSSITDLTLTNMSLHTVKAQYMHLKSANFRNEANLSDDIYVYELRTTTSFMLMYFLIFYLTWQEEAICRLSSTSTPFPSNSHGCFTLLLSSRLQTLLQHLKC